MFTALITNFGNLIFEGIKRIINGEIILFSIFMVISITLTILYNLKASIEEMTKVIIEKSLIIVVMVGLLKSWPTFISTTLSIFIGLGTLFGDGGSYSPPSSSDISTVLSSVGNFLDIFWTKGLEAFGVITTGSILSSMVFGNVLISILFLALFFYSYALMILQIAAVIIEYLLIGGLTIIFLPFYGLDLTKSFGLKSINTIMALGIRVLVTFALSTMAMAEIETFGRQLDIIFNAKDFDVLGAFGTGSKMLLLGYLVKETPKIVTSLISGNGNALSIRDLKSSLIKATSLVGAGAITSSKAAKNTANVLYDAYKNRDASIILNGIKDNMNIGKNIDKLAEFSKNKNKLENILNNPLHTASKIGEKSFEKWKSDREQKKDNNLKESNDNNYETSEKSNNTNNDNMKNNYNNYETSEKSNNTNNDNMKNNYNNYETSERSNNVNNNDNMKNNYNNYETSERSNNANNNDNMKNNYNNYETSERSNNANNDHIKNNYKSLTKDEIIIEKKIEKEIKKEEKLNEKYMKKSNETN